MKALFKSSIFFITILLEFNPLQARQTLSEEKCLKIYTTYALAFEKIELNENKLIFKNGAEVLCDDDQDFDLISDLGFNLQLENIDISDILLQDYPLEYSAPIKFKNYSPGRFRNDQLFINTYADISKMSKAEKKATSKKNLTVSDLKIIDRYVYDQIVDVMFLGEVIRMNKRNNAALALQRVGERLSSEFPAQARWLKETRNMAGGYNLRFISGSSRLSSHSWGIAVDFTLKNATENLRWFDSYWKWVAECLSPLKCSPARTDIGANERKQASESELSVLIHDEHFDHFPPELVQVFAEEGFIWGGHWHHFDTMHFEYRPEFF